jgi:hypothetical protein
MTVDIIKGKVGNVVLFESYLYISFTAIFKLNSFTK